MVSALNDSPENTSTNVLTNISAESCDPTSGIEREPTPKYVPEKDIDHLHVSQLLKKIRTENLHNVIIGHPNVNLFVSKLDAIKTIIPDKIDIMMLL